MAHVYLAITPRLLLARYLRHYHDSHDHEEKQGYRRPLEVLIILQEPGEMCYLPWFAVYVGDEMIERINATDVCLVQYRESV